MSEDILTKENVERLLAGRKLIDQYRQEQTGEKQPEAMEKLMAGLKELGFKSIDEFMKFNRQMIFADGLRCIENVGVCDYCANRTDKPSCDALCVVSLEAKGYHPTIDKDGIYPRGRTDEEVAISVGIARAFWDYRVEKYNNAKVGDVIPIMPGCAIKNIIVKQPLFPWYWR
jgi:hypothetical protein